MFVHRAFKRSSKIWTGEVGSEDDIGLFIHYARLSGPRGEVVFVNTSNELHPMVASLTAKCPTSSTLILRLASEGPSTRDRLATVGATSSSL